MSPGSLASVPVFASIRRHQERVPAPDELWQVHILGDVLCHSQHVPYPARDAFPSNLHHLCPTQRRVHLRVGPGNGLEFG